MNFLHYFTALGFILAGVTAPCFGMGHNPESKPEKRIVETADLCDPEEQTEVPLHY